MDNTFCIQYQYTWEMLYTGHSFDCDHGHIMMITFSQFVLVSPQNNGTIYIAWHCSIIESKGRCFYELRFGTEVK